MTVLSRAQICAYAKGAGFTGAALDEIVAVALAESGGDTQHVNVNKSGSTAVVNGKTIQVPAGTKDRGLVQINDWWNNGKSPPGGGGGALVTDAQAFDPAFSMQWAYGRTGGKQPSAASDPFKAFWVTVQNGAYKSHLVTGGCSGVSGTTTSGVSSLGAGLAQGLTATTLAGAGTATSASTSGSILPTIDLSPITNWLGSLQPLWNWLSNPIRVVKMIVGIMLIGISAFLLIAPEDTDKIVDMAQKAVEEGAAE